jgi:hypothetical protein
MASVRRSRKKWIKIDQRKAELNDGATRCGQKPAFSISSFALVSRSDRKTVSRLVDSLVNGERKGEQTTWLESQKKEIEIAVAS